MSVPTVNIIPLPGPDNPARNYLNIVLDPNFEYVIVRPGTSGSRLPKFWATWLRDLVTEHGGHKDICEVRIAGDRVYISSSLGPARALVVAQAAARHIHELPRNDLVRVTWRGLYGREAARWGVRSRDEDAANGIPIEDSVTAVSQLVSTIRLPHGCKLHVGSEWLWPAQRECVVISLTRDKHQKLPLRELASIVEARYALARERANS